MDYRSINPDFCDVMAPFTKESDKETLQYAIGALLYMPATNIKIAGKIIAKNNPHLKSMVLCLEDSIGDSMVAEAEECVKRTLTELHSAVLEERISIADLPLIFIRVREHGQMARIVEKCGSAINMITGFVLPKFTKQNALKYITEFQAITDAATSPLYMMPIIESHDVMSKATRMENLDFVYNALKHVADRVLCIRVGGTDFCNNFGIRRAMDQTIWDIAVVANCIADIVNVFGRDYVISGPTWEYFVSKINPEDTVWAEGLKKELRLDMVNGLIGKTCIHPSQIPYIQESLIVPKSVYDNAIQTLGMSNQTFVGVKKSVSGDQMIEVKTHGFWAKKTVALARIYGVK